MTWRAMSANPTFVSVASRSAICCARAASMEHDVKSASSAAPSLMQGPAETARHVVGGVT
jgi:hypothetical protein